MVMVPNFQLRRSGIVIKGMSISGVSDEEIQRIEDWINNYPRKCLVGKVQTICIRSMLIIK